MMRVSLGSIVLFSAASAAAQPAPAPVPTPAPVAAAACEVELVHVPESMAAVIEDWVHAERHCAVRLSVRVIPTEGGFYVMASDPSGRVRERVVPDATTAAVLIASWAADDGGTLPAPAPASAPTPAASPAAPAAVTAPAAAPTAWAPPLPAPAPGGPGTVAPAAAPGAGPVDVGATGSARPGFDRLFTAGIAIHEDGGGLRGDFDIRRLWRLRLGVMAAWSHTESYAKYRDLALDDVIVAAQASHELRTGRLSARASVAAGFAVTTGTHMDGSHTADSMVTPIVDTMVIGGLRVRGRLELRAGVEATLLPQRINNGEWFWDRGLVPQIFIGLGYRGE